MLHYHSEAVSLFVPLPFQPHVIFFVDNVKQPLTLTSQKMYHVHSETKKTMKKIRFLIQASYGYSGMTHTGYIDFVFSSLSIWELEYDGTLIGEKEALINAQSNSNHVKAFNEVCIARNLDPNIGRWLVFSVIDKE